jgi:hypothetical protein
MFFDGGFTGKAQTWHEINPFCKRLALVQLLMISQSHIDSRTALNLMSSSPSGLE